MEESTSVAGRDPGRPPEHAGAGTDTFTELTEKRESEIDGLLDLPWWHWRRPWDSESRKSLARIKNSVQMARDLHDRDALGTSEPRFARLLERPLAGRSLDGLIELVYGLDEALVMTGDEAYLRRRECAELLPDGDETTLAAVDEFLSRASPQPESPQPESPQPESPQPESPQPESPQPESPQPESTQQALLTLYEMRRFRYRRQRARRRMRTGVLLLAGALLLALAGALAIVIDNAVDGDPNLVLLAAIAGALGGTLANVFRLRDELSRGTELRAFKPMLLAQPAVGATAGLVLLLTVEGGFLGIADQDDDVRWATVTLLAFAAGTSEALFLGILRKAAAAVGEGAAPKSR